MTKKNLKSFTKSFAFAKTLFMVKTLLLGIILLMGCANAKDTKHLRPTTPIMGWSSWNHFRIKIDEKMIRQQADIMATNGMKEAGYQFINIDDGFHGPRDSNKRLTAHTKKFPSGMKALATYIHSKGLKAGIYSEAGKDLCSVFYDKNPIAKNTGLLGYEDSDIKTYLVDWNYDFLKVDWCSGKKLKLDKQERYTQIGKKIRRIKPSAIYNICCWKFPGAWATNVADSWRISGDISPHFTSSIVRIIDINKNRRLHRYAGKGNFNDMDMLQVGRGMSYEEDKSHFTMWAFLNSPLLAGNDLRTMSQETLSILTNKDIIALNQDPLAVQGVCALRNKTTNKEIWLRPLTSDDKKKAVWGIVLFNRANKDQTFNVRLADLNITGKVTARDLWLKKDLGPLEKTFKQEVPKHGVVVLKVTVANTSSSRWKKQWPPKQIVK